MGCSRCEERRKAIAAGAASAAKGNVRGAAASAAFVARTMVQDARSGALRTAAANQLAQLRGSIKRR
jgi:hypothetical protein